MYEYEVVGDRVSPSSFSNSTILGSNVVLKNLFLINDFNCAPVSFLGFDIRIAR